MLLLKQTPRRENHRRKIYEHKLISLLFDRVSFFFNSISFDQNEQENNKISYESKSTR